MSIYTRTMRIINTSTPQPIRPANHIRTAIGTRNWSILTRISRTFTIGTAIKALDGLAGLQVEVLEGFVAEGSNEETLPGNISGHVVDSTLDFLHGVGFVRGEGRGFRGLNGNGEGGQGGEEERIGCYQNGRSFGYSWWNRFRVEVGPSR